MTPLLTEDARDLIAEFLDHDVRFLLVGAHALAVYGLSRGTIDLDLLVEPTVENAQRVMAALEAYGAPVRAHGVTMEDFCDPGTVYQMGLPPNRIDILTEISGVPFAQAWAGRVEHVVDALRVGVLGREAMLANKRATGRPKDLADVAALESLDLE